LGFLSRLLFRSPSHWKRCVIFLIHCPPCMPDALLPENPFFVFTPTHLFYPKLCFSLSGGPFLAVCTFHSPSPWLHLAHGPLGHCLLHLPPPHHLGSGNSREHMPSFIDGMMTERFNRPKREIRSGLYFKFKKTHYMCFEQCMLSSDDPLLVSDIVQCGFPTLLGDVGTSGKILIPPPLAATF